MRAHEDGLGIWYLDAQPVPGEAYLNGGGTEERRASATTTKCNCMIGLGK